MTQTMQRLIESAQVIAIVFGLCAVESAPFFTIGTILFATILGGLTNKETKQQ